MYLEVSVQSIAGIRMYLGVSVQSIAGIVKMAVVCRAFQIEGGRLWGSSWETDVSRRE